MTEETPGEVGALLVLAVLTEGPAHGYEIGRRVRERSGEVLALPEGSLYPLLHALEADGLVASEWQAGAGRRRRVYALTGPGDAALRREYAAWSRRASGVERILRGVRFGHEGA